MGAKFDLEIKFPKIIFSDLDQKFTLKKITSVDLDHLQDQDHKQWSRSIKQDQDQFVNALQYMVNMTYPLTSKSTKCKETQTFLTGQLAQPSLPLPHIVLLQQTA